ncbi:thiamine phosphate synthase [Parvibaculum sp.]|uniref:thiamine phosphate synthase n=1 Tax=Parvibaculum sp. TaxID=2024848 RepID=UPI00320DF398
MKSDQKLVPHRKAGKRKLPRIVVMTDAARAPDPIEALNRAPRGAAVIYRAYNIRPRRTELARLGKLARRKGVHLLIAGDLLAGASPGIGGLHLPEHVVRQSTDRCFRRRPRPEFLITAAAHSESAVIAAARAGADAVFISPVFATQSHPGARPLGVVRFAQLAAKARARGLAVYALGGITGKAAEQRLSGTGIAGIAGIGLGAKQKERA